MEENLPTLIKMIKNKHYRDIDKFIKTLIDQDQSNKFYSLCEDAINAGIDTINFILNNPYVNHIFTNKLCLIIINHGNPELIKCMLDSEFIREKFKDLLEPPPLEYIIKFLEKMCDLTKPLDLVANNRAKTITIVTNAPNNTKGDIFSALKIIQVLSTNHYEINWIINSAGKANSFDSIKTNLLQLKHFLRDLDLLKSSNITVVIVEDYHWTCLYQSRETTAITYYMLLLSNAIMVYPTVEYLENIGFKKLLAFNKPIILASEYGHDSIKILFGACRLAREGVEDIARKRKDIFYFYTGPGMINEIDYLSSESDQKTQQLGMYFENRSILCNKYIFQNLSSEEQKKIIGEDINHDLFDNYIKNHDLFFAYVNNSEPYVNERLASFYLMCIKLSIESKPSKAIILLGTVSRDTFEMLKQLINADQSLQKKLELSFDNDKQTLHTDLSTDAIQVRMINPFPLSNTSMLTLMNESNKAQHPVLITGDQSLSEAISIGGPFLYQAMFWKRQLEKDLIKLAAQNKLSKLSEYLELYQKFNTIMYDPETKIGSMVNLVEEIYSYYVANKHQIIGEYQALYNYIPNLYVTLLEKINNIFAAHNTIKFTK